MGSARTLLIRPGAIGDFILSLPALEHLKSDYTEVWCAEQNVPLAVFADRAQSIISSGLDRVLPADDVLERLSTFDRIVSWYGSARADFREALRDFPIEFHTAIPNEGCTLHATSFYCAQVGAPAKPPSIPVPESERQPWTVIHPLASSRAKQWPLERFQELAVVIGEVRWCVGPEEFLENATRIANLFELACWLKGARLYIGNDSGPTHLAAAIGVPTVAIFRATDPGIWAPQGDNVRVVRSRMEGGPTLPEVAEAVKSCLLIPSDD